MGDVTTRAVIIGVNIFVTITIVSLIIIMFSQMGEIYGVVANTDTSITSKFDNIYSMYHGRTETGVGLLNAIKYFEENEEYDVVIKYTSSGDIRAYLEEYNQGRDEENQITEARYLKIMMEKSKLTAEGFKEKYGNKYDNLRKIDNFTYEYRYNVTVSEDENGILEINFTKIN